MANILTLIDKQRAIGNKVIFRFKVVLSGSYAQGGAIGVPGETLSFNTALNPNYIARPKLPGAPAGKLPANADFLLRNLPAGFDGRVEQNATLPTQANYALRLFSSGGTEISTGAYSSVGATLVDATGITIEVTVPARYN